MRLVADEDTLRAKRLLRRILRSTSTTSIRTEATLQLAECLLIERRLSDARSTIRALDEMPLSPKARLRRDVLVGYVLALIGRPREAIAMARRALSMRSQIDTVRADALVVVGLGLLRTGHYLWAERALNQAAACFRLQGLDTRLAYCLIDLGLVAKNRGRLQQALLHLDEANRLICGKPARRTRLLLLVNRGICLLHLGRLAQARTSLLRAHEIADQTGNDFVMVGVQNNLGHVYRLEGNHETAMEFYREALHSARRQGAHRKECLSLEFLGETHLEMDQPERALGLLNDAEQLALRFAGRGDLMGEVLRRRGETFAALGQRSSAQRDLRRAIEICDCRDDQREGQLSRRALALIDWNRDSYATLKAILQWLDEFGDRMEYARTIYMTLKRGSLSESQLAELGDAIAKAHYYLASSGSPYWKHRLSDVSAIQRPVATASPGSPRLPLPVETRSKAIIKTLEDARVAARSKGPALIHGETGVGKEVVARFIHQWSDRAQHALVAVNCGALAENLIESELFGHSRGAFTGADRDRIGLLETAHDGTLFLDEIADLPLHIQVKLLRFLDQGDLRRVGETKTRWANVRILAATNKDIPELARRGKFREDLMYRLNVFRIRVPPLRERHEDIVPLAQAFLSDDNSTLRLSLGEDVIEWMKSYAWPGNVRELRNLCEYFAAHAWGKETVEMADLPVDLVRPGLATTTCSAFEQERLALERSQIERALETTRGNISNAARLLGLGRNTVAKRMREYGIARHTYA